MRQRTGMAVAAARWAAGMPAAAAATAAAVALAPLPARAAELYVDGGQAKVLCGEHPDWCVGFVTGALDGWSALEVYYDGDKFCLPADMTTGGITDVFRKALASEATDLTAPAAYILYERLIGDHPCG